MEETRQEKISSIFSALGQFTLSFIETIVVALVISVILYLFVVTPHEVVGKSMFPTYKDGEYLMANKVTYRFSEPKRGDVIIFEYSETQDFIKRIIGLPGDKVSLMDGKLLVNGEELDESNYLDSSIYTNGGSFLKEGETKEVPDGEYFVCGDNRQHSSDSREFGTIKKSAIKGKVLLVYYPFSSFRLATEKAYD